MIPKIIIRLRIRIRFQMDFFRFSISWSRVLPTGDITNVNEKGIEYYNKIIDKLLEYNIEPMVTIFHYDFPQELQKFGSFTNAIIIDYFTEYANLLFERFGDRVKYWITFNQPRNLCIFGFGSAMTAPGINFHGIGEYLCRFVRTLRLWFMFLSVTQNMMIFFSSKF